MPWYYYSGRVVKAIPIKKGVSLAARPRTKIEIIDDTIGEIQSMIFRGVLKRTGKPRDAAETPKEVEPVKDIEKSEMAKAIAEKGVTRRDKGSQEIPPPPKKPVGAPEMTEGELKIVETEVTAKENGEDDMLSGEKDGKKKKKSTKKNKKK